MTSRKSKLEIPHTLSEERKNSRYKRSTFKQLLPVDSVDLGNDEQAGEKNDGGVTEKGHTPIHAGKKQRKRTNVPSDKSPKRQTSAKSCEKRSKSRVGESDRTRLSVQGHIARLSDGLRDGIVDKNTQSGADSKDSNKDDKAKKSGKRNGKSRQTKKPARLPNSSESNKRECKATGKDGEVGNVHPKVESGRTNSGDKPSFGTKQTPSAKKRGSSHEKQTGSLETKSKDGMKLPDNVQSSTSSGSNYNYSPDQDWEITNTTASSSGDSGPAISNDSPLVRKESFSANTLRDKGQGEGFYRNDDNKVANEQDVPDNVKEDKSTSTISTASLRETTFTGDTADKRKKQHSPRPRPRRDRALSPKTEKEMAAINAVISETSVSVGKLTSAIIASNRGTPIKDPRNGKSKDGFVPTSSTKKATMLKSKERRESPSIERGRKGVHNSPSKPRRKLEHREAGVIYVKRDASKQKRGVRDRSVRQRDSIYQKVIDKNDYGMMPVDCPVQTDVPMRKSKVRFKIPDKQNTDESDLSLSSDRSVNSDRYQASSSANSTLSERPAYYDSECSTCNGKRDRSYYDSDCSTCNSSRGFSGSDNDNQADSKRSPSHASISSENDEPLSVIPRSKPFIVSTKPGKKVLTSCNKSAKSCVSPTKTEKYDRISSTPTLSGCHSARTIRSKDVTKKSSTNIPRFTSAAMKNIDLSKVPRRLMMYAVPVSSHPKSESELIKYLHEKSTKTQINTRIKSEIKNTPEPTRRWSNQNNIQQRVHESRYTNAKDKRTADLPKCASLAETLKVTKNKSGPSQLASNDSKLVKSEIVKKTGSSIGTRDKMRQSKDPRPVTRSQVTVAVKQKKSIQDSPVRTATSVKPKKYTRPCVQTRLSQGDQSSMVKRGDEKSLEKYVQKKSGHSIALGSANRSSYTKIFN